MWSVGCGSGTGSSGGLKDHQRKGLATLREVIEMDRSKSGRRVETLRIALLGPGVSIATPGWQESSLAALIGRRGAEQWSSSPSL